MNSVYLGVPKLESSTYLELSLGFSQPIESPEQLVGVYLEALLN